MMVFYTFKVYDSQDVCLELNLSFWYVKGCPLVYDNHLWCAGYFKRGES